MQQRHVGEYESTYSTGRHLKLIGGYVLSGWDHPHESFNAAQAVAQLIASSQISSHRSSRVGPAADVRNQAPAAHRLTVIPRIREWIGPVP